MRITQGNTQAGIAAIEFILVLPVLLILMVSLSEIGSIFIKYNTLNKLTQSGCRYAVIHIYGTATTNQIADINKIKNVILHGNDLGSGAVKLDSLTADNIMIEHVDHFVTVTVSYDYIPFIERIPFFDIPLTLTISATSMMRTG